MNAASVNLLHVLGGTQLRGGMANVVVRLSRLPLNGGVRPQIWMHRTFAPPAGDELYVCRGTASRVNGTILQDALAGWREALALSAWLAGQRRVVLHAHSRVGLMAASLAGRWRRVPVVLHAHFLPNRPWIYHALRRHVRAEWVFNAHKTCRHFGADPARSHVLMPAVDWPEVSLPAGPGRLRFVAAGAFVPGKHLDVLIAAFGRLRAQGMAGELALFGRADVPDAPDCQRTIEKVCAGDSAVTLHPWSAGWPQALTTDDVFVHLGQPESFGLVILEAFVRGSRLVVLPETFLDELPVPHGQAGIWRARALTVDAVAAAMQEAAASASAGVDFWASRRPAQGIFCMEQQAVRLSSLYHDMIARSTGR